MIIDTDKLDRLLKKHSAVNIAVCANMPLRTIERMRSKGIGPQRLDTVIQLWKWARWQK